MRPNHAMVPSDDPPELRGRGAVMLGFAESAAKDGNYFFYVRIPEDIGPLDRGDRYEDPLREALTTAGVGEVTGGGSQLGEGSSVEYCGIDIVATDRERALALIRDTMQRLGAPSSTVIEEYLPSYREHELQIRNA
jgi:hypothetical protein